MTIESSTDIERRGRTPWVRPFFVGTSLRRTTLVFASLSASGRRAPVANVHFAAAGGAIDPVLGRIECKNAIRLARS